MPRRGHSRNSHYMRTIVVKTDGSYERDLFLGIGIPMLDDIDVGLDTRLNRIELTLTGEYDDVDRLIGQLRKLESYIYNALNPDRDGFFLYHNLILTQICTPPVNLDLFASALGTHGFTTETVSNELRTKAPIDDVKQVHAKVIDLRSRIFEDLNRDIERFVIEIALMAGTTEVNQIMDTAIDLRLIKRTDYGLQFAVAHEVAQRKILEHLKIDDTPTFEPEAEDVRDMTLDDFLFDGGKVVFMRDGKEIDESEFDT